MSESGGASFGDAAGEMANETEVEVPVSGTSAPAGASANAGHQPPTADESGPADTSGVGDMVEEGAPLEPADLAEASAVEPSVEDQLAERTADLQRLSAEYANYRKRVDRERLVVAQNAAFKALTPVIDVARYITSLVPGAKLKFCPPMSVRRRGTKMLSTFYSIKEAAAYLVTPAFSTADYLRAV